MKDLTKEQCNDLLLEIDQLYKEIEILPNEEIIIRTKRINKETRICEIEEKISDRIYEIKKGK